MRRILLLVALAAIFLGLGAGCRKAGGAMPGNLVYIDEVEVPDRARAGEDVVVTIQGNLPDPSWALLRNEVSVEAATVTIDVLGVQAKGGGAVAMVLVPFTTTATLSGLPEGQLTVEVRGRQKTISKPLEIVK